MWKIMRENLVFNTVLCEERSDPESKYSINYIFCAFALLCSQFNKVFTACLFFVYLCRNPFFDCLKYNISSIKNYSNYKKHSR
jgi:hypothetical protein